MGYDELFKRLWKMPWEDWVFSYRTEEVIAAKPAVAVIEAPSPPAMPARAPTPAPTPAQPERIMRPGCTAADETLVVKGHLEGIVQGLWGSGVLQHDLERMDRAIAGARQMGAPEVAAELAGIKAALPAIRDTESASRALAMTNAVVPRVGELGTRCGAAAGRMAQTQRMVDLARRVSRGELTKEQAYGMLGKEAQ